MILAVDESNCRKVTMRWATRIGTLRGSRQLDLGVSAALNECENRRLASMTAAVHEEEAVCH